MSFHYYMCIILILMQYQTKYIKSGNVLERYKVIKNFNSFNELNFTNFEQVLETNIILMPNKFILLNDSLNLTGLTVNLYGFKILNPYSIRFYLCLNNLKGIDLESNPIKTLKAKPEPLDKCYILFNSNFDFYHKNKLIDSGNCDLKLLLVETSFFSNIPILDVSMSSIKFKPNMCPLIFYNASISIFKLSSTNSLLIRNVFSFENISLDLAIFIRSKISAFQVNFYHADLDSSLLDKNVFRSTRILSIRGIVNSIQFDLFKSFLNLRFLNFRLENLRNFFKKDLKWINYLNYMKKFDLENIKDLANIKDYFQLVITQILPKFNYYDYPDKDFCLFKDYPHEKLVLALLDPIQNNTNDVSCTFLYLTKYSHYFQDDLYTKYGIRLLSINFDLKEAYKVSYIEEEYLKFKSLNRLNTNCTQFIQNKLKLCSLNEFKNNKEKNNDFYFYQFDFRLFSKFNSIMFELILNPIFCLISFLFSILFLYILSNKKVFKNLNNYSYLKSHNYFISIYFFVSFFKLFYVCINISLFDDIRLNVEFCLNSDFFQSNGIIFFYLNIILIKLIGNSFKTCSTIFYLLFSLNRYILITDKKTKYFKEKSAKFYLLLTLILSLLINLHIFFQFNNSFDLSKSRYSFHFLSYLNFDLNDYTEDLNEIALNLLKYLNIFKIIFSDFILIFMGIYIDFKLYLFIKNKPKISNNLRQNNNKRQIIKKQRKEKESQNRISSMIILNGLNSFLFRIPSSIFSLYGFIFRFDVNTGNYLPNYYAYSVCRTEKLCYTLENITFFFYLLSFIFQFFIFFKLDKNFRESFKEFYEKFKKKNQKKK